MIILDLFITLLQSLFVGEVIYRCLGKTKIRRINIILVIIFFTAIFSQLFYNLLGEYEEFGPMIAHVFSLIFIVIIFRENKYPAITAYSLTYIIQSIFSIIVSNIMNAVMNVIIPFSYHFFVFAYISQLIMIIASLMNLKLIKSFLNLIINEGLQKNIVIITFILDFVCLFYKLSVLEKDNQLLDNIAHILFSGFIIALVLYFNQIYKKSESILALNKALESKNNDLRKIKHDYGAQISYLYALCLMNRYDDLKEALKKIIDNNQSTKDAVEVNIGNNEKNSIISVALRPAIEKGINVILEEECSLDSLEISEMELYRIVSNIVSNAIRAMKGKGTIRVKTYKFLSEIIIKIANNGPRIPENHLEDIFKRGYTTKENFDEAHGYGLSIVKEIVQNNNGNITAHSTDEETEFKIIFKVKH